MSRPDHDDGAPDPSDPTGPSDVGGNTPDPPVTSHGSVTPHTPDAVRTRRRRLAGLGAGAAVIAVLAAVAVFNAAGGPAPAPGPQAVGRDNATTGPGGASPSAVPTIAGPRPPSVETALMLGRPTAPVTIVEFGDFQCPSCGRFARDIKPALVREYLDTGIVRIAWRDFPTFGKQSVAAAVAGRAAARQGRFWQFHDTLYARRLPPRSGRLTRAYLRGVAEDAGLELGRYDTDVRDERLREVVDADFAFGQGLGVPGTPAFLINGEAFFGAQPLAAFKRAIEQARAEA